MRRIVLISLMLSMVGCGLSEPSTAEIERGMKNSFMRRTGAYSANIDASAKKIGNGRWYVRMTIEKDGFRRTLNATAVMDKNGDIHYYTD